MALWILAACGGPVEGVNPNGTGSHGGEDPGPDRPACGPVVTDLADGCTTAADCGESNVGERLCSNCPAESLNFACSSGECVRYDRESDIAAKYTVPARADAAGSAVEMVIWPWTSDGRRLTCADLLNGCDLDRSEVNVLNVNITNPPALTAFRTYDARVSSPTAEDMIFVMRLVSRRGGEGTVMAEDCVEGIDVPFSSVPTVQLTFGQL